MLRVLSSLFNFFLTDVGGLPTFKPAMFNEDLPITHNLCCDYFVVHDAPCDSTLKKLSNVFSFYVEQSTSACFGLKHVLLFYLFFL